MKKEHFICLIITLITLILYVIAANKYINNYRVLVIISGISMIILTANLLLFKCLKKENNYETKNN